MAVKIMQLQRVVHKPSLRKKHMHGENQTKELRYPELRHEPEFEHHGLRGFKGPKKWLRKGWK